MGRREPECLGGSPSLLKFLSAKGASVFGGKPTLLKFLARREPECLGEALSLKFLARREPECVGASRFESFFGVERNKESRLRHHQGEIRGQRG